MKKRIVERRALRRCHGCDHSFRPGEMVISAEKAGPGCLWHTWCFTCITCDVALASFLYYYSEGHLYCGRWIQNAL